MNTKNFNELDIAPPAVVFAAARDFAAALAETPQFKAFEQAYDALRIDTVAQQALAAHQEKFNSLRIQLMLNAVSEAERNEIERLQNEYLKLPSVQAYINAQTELTTICQQIAGMISAAVGLNYAAACGASCCG